MTLLPKVVYRINAIHIKNIPWFFFFAEVKRLILKVTWNLKGPLIAKRISEKNKRAGGQNFPILNSLQSYSYQNSVVLTWGHTDQWNKTVNPENNLCIYGQTIFNKGDKFFDWVKGSLFNKWCWGKWVSMCKIRKLDPYLTAYTKTNWKRLKWRPKAKNS